MITKEVQDHLLALGKKAGPLGLYVRYQNRYEVCRLGTTKPIAARSAPAEIAMFLNGVALGRTHLPVGDDNVLTLLERAATAFRVMDHMQGISERWHNSTTEHDRLQRAMNEASAIGFRILRHAIGE